MKRLINALFFVTIIVGIAADGLLAESVEFVPVRGVFRGANDQPVRRIHIKLDPVPVPFRPVTLRLKSAAPAVSIERQLTDSADIDIPVSETPFRETPLFGELTLEAALLQTKADGTLLLVLEKNITLPPEKKQELYLIHQTHLDIGYTHTQQDVLKRQVQSLRDALKYIEETKNYPDEAKFRFHPEGMWAVEQFLKEATAEEKAAFIKAAKSRDLHIDGMYAQAMTGMYNDEELFELFGGAVRFCRENGIELDSVMQTDVPGYTWGLVTVMAQNGIKYMTMGPNGGHRCGHLYEWGDKPFWWVSPSGKEKILCWLHDTGYNQFHGQKTGHRLTEKEVFTLLDGRHINTWGRSKNIGKQELPFEDFVVVRYGIEGDNGRPNRVLSDVVKEWNEKYLYPKLIISRNSDVMRILEKRYGDKLPVLRGDYTGYWEDGSASTSAATAINRRAKEQLVQAGIFWSMLDPKKYPKAEFDAVWTDLVMYDEHTWGASLRISTPDSDFAKQQDAYKREYAQRGSRKAGQLLEAATSAEIIDSGSSGSLLVNTSSHIRSGVCYIGKFHKSYFEGTQQVKMFQTKDGKAVPVQGVANPDSSNTVSVYADLQWGANSPNIPALGAIQLKASDAVPDNRTGVFRIDTATGEMRNKKVRLIIDTETGAIRSLKLAGNDHDFVNPGDDGNRGLNDYLYIIGRNAQENRSRSTGKVKLTVVADGPLAASVLVESEPGSVPDAESFKRQITLFADTEKIRIENVINKKKERRPEGMFFGFPFNVPDGKWYVDSPWALVEVDKDQLAGANRNYYPVQRFCALANENCGVNWVTVDANMVQFAPIITAGPFDLSQWRKTFQPNGTIYSWVCNNHWETNYKADQEGELKFEYWIWVYHNAKYNNSIAQRFARQVHQPILQFRGSTAVPNPLLTFTNEGNIITTSIRPVRDGSGALLVRLFNTTKEKQSTAVIPAAPYKTVYKSNPLEAKLGIFDKGELNPMETITLRIE
ncbi:MAG: hypothetical protein LBT89_09925 [Planctomycetaceae bacterium]|jgi:hypothetical protein|nr:hypothetical protein [Planctomycetaceae bacterium]